MASHAAWQGLYAALLMVRLGCALYGKAYIHPDEWFQNGEAIMGDLFDVPTYKTWEFQPSFPCRSMASLRFFALPLAALASLLRGAGIPPSAQLLFVAQRLNALVLSLLLDWSFVRLVHFSSKDRATRKLDSLRSLCLIASSHVLLTFCVRPFSNSIEAALLSICLVCMRNLIAVVFGKTVTSVSSRESWQRNASVLGILVALGLFARFTIVALLLPSAVTFLWAAWSLSRRATQGWLSQTRRFISLVSDAASSFLLVSAFHVAYDTIYYRSRLPGQTKGGSSLDTLLSGAPILTPLNAFLYNLRPSNLEEHGLHPRWLHFSVNAPLIFGASVWVFLLIVSPALWMLVEERKDDERGGKEEQRQRIVARARSAMTLEKLLMATVLVGIALLSVQPHQEPRFLVPLALPALVPFAHWVVERGGSRRTKRLALSLFLAQSLLSTAFFGFLHQGGVVPALLSVNARISTHPSLLIPPPAVLETTRPTLPPVSVHVWRLFMPPPHLVLPPSCRPRSQGGQGESSACQLSNHASVDAEELARRLARAKEERQAEEPQGLSKSQEAKAYMVLIAPTWALADLDALAGSENLRWSSKTRFGPHLDMDHLGETWAVWRSEGAQGGLSEALAVQVRELEL